MDKERAQALLKSARLELEELGRVAALVSKERIVEYYYDTLKKLIVGLMYAEGYKTLSHKALLEYLERHHTGVLSKSELGLLELLRKVRNGISYYGEPAPDSLLFQQEDRLKQMVGKLIAVLGERVAL